MHRPILLSFVLAGLATWLPAEEPADASRAARVEFFEARIRPVLVQHCQACHAAGAKPLRGGLRLDTREGWQQGGESGAAIVPGKPDESLLLSALRHEGLEMPPSGRLSDRVVADFEQWIRDGAEDPRDGTTAGPASAAPLWSLQPPRAAEAPRVQDESWPRRDIDRFVLAALDQAGLAPAPEAAPHTLLRRVALDLTGLPPTPEETREFLADHAADPNGAWERLVERLLASDAYGERWARHWLDVARYAEDQAHTFKARNYPRGFLYRDWVVGALNDDLPYNEFLRRQIAGDLLDGAAPHQDAVALGLFALGPVYYAENVEQARATADEWDDRIDTLARGVLGLTIGCARCHDHKFDPITMEDYYGLAGVFAGSKYLERPAVPADVVERRREADSAAAAAQVAVDNLLGEQARRLRPTLTADIPKYVEGAWRVGLAGDKEGGKRPKQDAKQRAKRIEEVAKGLGISPALLTRWVEQAAKAASAASNESAPIDWAALRTAIGEAREDDADPATDAPLPESLAVMGEQLKMAVESRAPRRDALFARFGDNLAFVAAADRATVIPGQIPLGNLFDDKPTTSLRAALASDQLRAAANADSLGVDRVAQGWGARTEIAPKLSFDFAKLGSSSHAHGAVLNDSWGESGSLRTEGRPGGGRKREEQGIGMHANALITFDLDELRRAGGLPLDQAFMFHADRAGLNDDAFGSGATAHLVVIVSKTPRDGVTDAILHCSVNGVDQTLGTDDFTYYLAGQPPEPMRADGRFATLAIPVPGEAKFLTLATTGAGTPEDNPISSDHTVFSGARLELSGASGLASTSTGETSGDDSDSQPASPEELADAELLSRFFYDEGLLALPGGEVEPKLDDSAKQRLAELRAEQKRLAEEAGRIEVPMAHSLAEGQGADLPIYLRGDPAQHGPVAQRSLPAALTGGTRHPFSSDGSGRRELADAIASPDNPLTARVIVNRVWSWHFGQGLVRTPSNLGQLGDRPSHPELLDTLAVQFMEHGWSLKWLHRELLLSATYRQSSRLEPRGVEFDPENRLLWRMNRQRLEVEPWRDSLLAVTGELDRSLGGPSSDLGNAGNRRRTLYGFVSRHRLDELLRLFDFPDPNITADRRVVTTVPLQQLFVLNSQFMLDRATALARRLRELAPDEAGQVSSAFELLFARAPRDAELAAALEFLAEPGGDDAEGLGRLEQYCLALLGSNEFLFVD